MKRSSFAILGFALASLFTTSAMAKDVDLKACTADGMTATLTAHINGDAIKTNPDLFNKLQKAFAETAGSMSAKDFNSDVGGQDFLGKALAIDPYFFKHVHFTADPTITPGCSL